MRKPGHLKAKIMEIKLSIHQVAVMVIGDLMPSDSKDTGDRGCFIVSVLAVTVDSVSHSRVIHTVTHSTCMQDIRYRSYKWRRSGVRPNYYQLQNCVFG